MTALGDLDRERIRNLRARELARFREARPATLAMLERARLHMPNGTPMAWMAVDYDLPVYVERGEGPGLLGSRRLLVRGFQRFGHGDVLRSRELRDRAGRAGASSALHPVPAADRGVGGG